jgi:zinc protease
MRSFRPCMLFLAGATAAALAVPAVSRATDLSAVISPGPQVKVGKLANGLTYYVQRNGRPQHRLELRLVVKAGSILEDEDQLGLAHFVEHMAFNGSTHFRRHELVSWLESIGVQFGADLNAYTSMDETVYLLPVPTGDKRHVEQAFTVLEDWAHGLSFDPAAIDTERSIVLEEARTRKGVGERVRRQLMPKLFNGARYAARDPIGKEEVLRSFQPDALRRFYRDWYRPDLMAVVAVGDIDPLEAERLIAAHFGGLKNPANARARTYEDIPPQRGAEALVLTDPELTVRQIALDYPPRYEPDPGTYGSYRDKLLERMVRELLAQRLADLAQQADPPFVGAVSAAERPTARHKAYAATVALGARGSAPALTALLQEHRRVREHGFSADELARARRIVLRDYESAFNERFTTASSAYADEYIRNFLANEEIAGIAAEYPMARELLTGFTLDELNAHARKTIPDGADKLVVYLGPNLPLTPAPSPAALLAELAAAETAPAGARDAKRLPDRLMARPAVPGRIVAETSDKTLGVTRLRLSNGIDVILKPTDFHKDQVLLRAERFGGLELFEPADLANARYAAMLVATMGLGDLPGSDITKILAGRQANVATDINSMTDSVSGDAGSSLDDIEAMLQLLRMRFGTTRRDEGLFQSTMRKQEEILRRRDAMPEARFEDAVTDTLYGKHPYAPRAIVAADLSQVDLDRSLALYRRRFGSAKGFTFTLVGNFRVETIKPLLAAYIGTLPTGELPLAYRDVGLRFADGVIKRELRAGSEPKSQVSLHFTGPASWSPDEQLRLDALMEVMNLRITDLLREKLGLIYGGSMGGTIERVPYQHYWIAANLPTGPEKVEAVTAALFSEIERLKKDGPDPADLAKVKSHWRESWPHLLRTNGYWLDVLNGGALFGIDPQRLLVRQARADAIKAEDIRQAARRYFNTRNYVQVVLNPEDAKPADKPVVAGAAALR